VTICVKSQAKQKKKQKHLGVLVTWIGEFLELMSKLGLEGGS